MNTNTQRNASAWIVLYMISLAFGVAQLLFLLHWGLSWKQIGGYLVLDVLAYGFLSTALELKRHPERFEQ